VKRGLETLLAEHPFFAGLEPDYVSFIAGCGSNVVFQPGDYIFREGEAADQFYIVRHGKVQMEIFVPERGPLVIETVSEGEVLGWSWLFPPYRWSLDARAVDVVRAVALDGACLRGKCDDDHHLGYELMKRFAPIIVKRLSATRLRLLDIYGRAAVP
jgi:CRP-like cAMP-binding protein